MAKKYNTSKFGNFSSGLNVADASPMDLRSVVERESDLFESSTWSLGGSKTFEYSGMIVAVENTGTLWMLIGVGNYTHKYTDKHTVTTGYKNTSDETTITVAEYEALEDTEKANYTAVTEEQAWRSGWRQLDATGFDQTTIDADIADIRAKFNTDTTTGGVGTLDKGALPDEVILEGDDISSADLKVGSTNLINAEGKIDSSLYTDTTYSAATATVGETTGTDGLMTVAMATKLAGIAEGATANVGTVTGIKLSDTVSATVDEDGIADLGSKLFSESGKIKDDFLPSYVDDVVLITISDSVEEVKDSEGNVTTAAKFGTVTAYLNGSSTGTIIWSDAGGKVEENTGHPVAGVIYADKDSNSTYRWVAGSEEGSTGKFVLISTDSALISKVENNTTNIATNTSDIAAINEVLSWKTIE